MSDKSTKTCSNSKPRKSEISAQQTATTGEVFQCLAFFAEKIDFVAIFTVNYAQTTRKSRKRSVRDVIATIQKRSDSQGICIAQNVLERKNIKELFADFHEEYAPIEVDWGVSVGEEIW